MLLIAVLAAGGCGPSKQQIAVNRAIEAYFAGDYAAAQQKLMEAAKKPDENFVLNNLRLGSAALARYDLDTAEEAFLRAYEVINSVGVNAGGRTLGAIFVDEKIKIWKGEPFERAMANFYLGLIYDMRQDYANARAAFENALFKLRDYADKNDARDQYAEQESNFVIGLMMLGRTWQKLGRDDLARASFDRVRELRPHLAPLVDEQRNATSNLLLVVEFGHGPQKVTDFDGSIVGFAPSPAEAGAIPPPRVTIDGQPVNLEGLTEPPIDLLAMAQDRRWQSIDTIRAIKSAVGSGLIVGGAGATVYGANRGREDTALAGLAMIGTGLLLKATSQADVRQWEMLPRTVFILPLRVPPGTHELTISFPHAGPGLHQTWRGIVVPSHGQATYYMRLQRWTSGTYTWPPAHDELSKPAPASPGANPTTH
ncbi:MAG TPA: hypothetical protein VNL70_09965 [Tepidisphaeraceae bacterium]|nr:hypothetical protein [Tepidisphaeraceae bacterium]